MKILLVDDDAELSSLIGFALRQAGYLVVHAEDGQRAIEVYARESPDLVILDYNLPLLSGLEALKRIRADGGTAPVMMLTVRSAEEDQVQALDHGADDYLTKPFSPRTLLARVRALLRRAGIERPAPLAKGDLALDIEQQRVLLPNRQAAALTNLESRLLHLLMTNAGHVLATERLTSHVWGYRDRSDRQQLKQLVHRLRQKIEQNPARPRYLKTVAGVGYRLDPEGRSGNDQT